MNVVVLGGSGFMGSHVCDALSQKGHNVKIFDLKKAKINLKNRRFAAKNRTIQKNFT